MSEYQYYEFQAIDQPLTERETATLRGFSSRATITPTRFVNNYSYGRRQKAEHAAREKARREREAAEARERHLSALAKRETEAWRELDALIATKQPKKYDEAVALLGDLRDVCVGGGRQAEAATRIARLREEHTKKPSLIDRFRKAGLTT